MTVNNYLPRCTSKTPKLRNYFINNPICHVFNIAFRRENLIHRVADDFRFSINILQTNIHQNMCIYPVNVLCFCCTTSTLVDCNLLCDNIHLSVSQQIVSIIAGKVLSPYLSTTGLTECLNVFGCQTFSEWQLLGLTLEQSYVRM